MVESIVVLSLILLILFFLLAVCILACKAWHFFFFSSSSSSSPTLPTQVSPKTLSPLFFFFSQIYDLFLPLLFGLLLFDLLLYFYAINVIYSYAFELGCCPFSHGMHFSGWKIHSNPCVWFFVGLTLDANWVFPVPLRPKNPYHPTGLIFFIFVGLYQNEKRDIGFIIIIFISETIVILLLLFY